MLQKIFFAAVVSGVIAGLFATAVQSARVIPLIYEAEKYEQKEPFPHSEAHENHAEEGSSRLVLTLVSNVVSAVGFALLLVGCFALHGDVDWRRGILWGVGGFVVFSLAPAVGLPPELPGSPAAPLPQRQLWWIITVVATATGLILLVFKPGVIFKVLGAVFIIFPHLIGAPDPQTGAGLAPHRAILERFILTVLIVSAAFWVVLGLCAGYFFNRLKG